MTPDVARFLLDLLSAQQLSVGAPDFEQTAAFCAQAKADLAQLAREDTPA